jgi:hypothetical protein
MVMFRNSLPLGTLVHSFHTERVVVLCAAMAKRKIMCLLQNIVLNPLQS